MPTVLDVANALRWGAVVQVNGAWRVGGLETSDWEQAYLGSATMAALPRWVLLVDGDGQGTVARVVGATFTTRNVCPGEPEREEEMLYTLVGASQVETVALELVGE